VGKQLEETVDKQAFADDLLGWYGKYKRDLPWRKDRNPYRVWVSEVMLQQTRVDTVIPYFERFMQLFPDISALAKASEDTVVKAWEGLGYYSRARNLQIAVREVVARYDGVVPDRLEAMTSLQGVGPYTAGAVLSIAYGKPVPAVDGNVLRVFARLLLIEDDIGKLSVRKRIETVVRDIIPSSSAADFNQAVMELGALVCVARAPRCSECPVALHCAAQPLGRAAQLPVKMAKKPVAEQHYAVLLLRRQDGALAIQQRPDKGLLRGLWQLPMVAVPDARADSVQVCAQTRESLTDESLYPVDHFTALGVYSHAFTHLRWTLRAVTANWLGVGPPNNLVFATQAQRAPLAFARVFQVILQNLAGDVEHKPVSKGGEQLAFFDHRDF